jgi:heme-degrading monooxygenase HmoA
LDGNSKFGRYDGCRSLYQKKDQARRKCQKNGSFNFADGALALRQPGYISGKTLSDLEHPGDCLIISTWESVDDWNRWKQSKERAHIENQIKALTGEDAHYNIYSPMTVSQTE